MVKVTSHLWFADGAEEAVRLYTGLVPGSSMGPRLTIPTDTPSGPAAIPASPVRWRDGAATPGRTPALGEQDAAIRAEFG